MGLLSGLFGGGKDREKFLQGLNQSLMGCMMHTIQRVTADFKLRYPRVFDTHDNDRMSVTIAYASAIACTSLKRPSLDTKVVEDVFRIAGELCPGADTLAVEVMKEITQEIDFLMKASRVMGMSVTKMIEIKVSGWAVNRLRMEHRDYRGREIEKRDIGNTPAGTALQDLYAEVDKMLGAFLPVPPPESWMVGASRTGTPRTLERILRDELRSARMTTMINTLEELPKRCAEVLNTSDRKKSVCIVFTGGIVCALVQRPNMPQETADIVYSVAESVCPGFMDLQGKVFDYVEQHWEQMRSVAMDHGLSFCQGVEICVSQWVINKLVAGDGDISQIRMTKSFSEGHKFIGKVILRFLSEKIGTCTLVSPPQNYTEPYQG